MLNPKFKTNSSKTKTTEPQQRKITSTLEFGIQEFKNGSSNTTIQCQYELSSSRKPQTLKRGIQNSTLAAILQIS